MKRSKLISCALLGIFCFTLQGLFALSDPVQVFVLQSTQKTRLIRTIGTIERDEERVLTVVAPASGWVEKSAFSKGPQKVTEGELLVELVSPERYGLEVAYLMAFDKQILPLMVSISQSLKAIGVSDDELAVLDQSHQAQKSYKLYAPVSGVIREKDQVLGALVRKGEPICTIADDQAMTLVAKIYEEDRAYFTVGDEVTVELPSLISGPIKAIIQAISNTKDAKTRAYEVRLCLQNSKAKVAPGTLSIARIEVIVASAIVCVPEQAILRNDTHNSVEVLDTAGERSLRTIILGPRVKDGYEVLDGVTAGEKVVLHTK